MAQVTVQQLAEVVGASSERLLSQMKEAGLPHTAADEAVSDEDKQTLLKFLKRSHGESTDAPKRITLKRKSISTLRTSGSQGKKTVAVEIRKKRTYVKRDAEENVAAEEAEKVVEVEKPEESDEEEAKVDGAKEEDSKDDVKPELATFRLKKGKAFSKAGGQKPQFQKGSKKDGVEKKKGKRNKSTHRTPKVMSAGPKPKLEDSPFAVLEQLKQQSNEKS